VKTRGGTSPELAPFPKEAMKLATEALNEIVAGTEDPEGQSYRVVNSILAADMVGLTPSEVLNQHDSVAKMFTGKASTPKEFFQALSKFYQSGTMVGRMAPLILRHGMGDRSPELEKQIRDLQAQMGEAAKQLPDIFAITPGLEGLSKTFTEVPTDRPPSAGHGAFSREGASNFIITLSKLGIPIAKWLGETEETQAALFEAVKDLPGPLELSAYEAAKIAPMYIEGLKEGAPWAIALGGGTAGAAVFATVLGHPEVGASIASLIPEMLGLGLKVGTLGYIGNIEWTQAYWDLMDKPILDADGNLITPNRQLTLALTAPIGIANMALENLQWDALLRPLGRGAAKAVGKMTFSELVKNKGTRDFMMPLLRSTQGGIREVLVGRKLAGVLGKLALKGGKEYIQNVTEESIEEGLQQAVTVVGEEIAKKLFAEVAGTEYEADWKRLWPEVWESIKTSAKGFAVLNAPGAMVGYVMEGTKVSTDLKKQTAAVDLVMRQVKGISRADAESVVKMSIEAENARIESGGGIAKARAGLQFEKAASASSQETFQKKHEGTQAVGPKGKPDVFINHAPRAGEYGSAYVYSSDASLAEDSANIPQIRAENDRLLKDASDRVAQIQADLKDESISVDAKVTLTEELAHLNAEVEARQLWAEKGVGMGVQPAYLDVKNSFDVTKGRIDAREFLESQFGERGAAVYTRLVAEAERRGSKATTLEDLTTKGITYERAKVLAAALRKVPRTDRSAADAVNAFLRSKGHDGLRLSDGWAVFSPKQITSPYNRAAFDTGVERPWIEKYRLDPENPPKIKGVRPAIQTRDGSIYYHPEWVDHVTAAQDLEIPHDEVSSSGYLMGDGRYVKFAGIKLKGARGGGISVAKFTKDAKEKFHATDEQIAGSLAALEAHAKTLGMTLEEWMSNRLIDIETGTEPSAYKLLWEAFATRFEPTPKNDYPAMMEKWCRERFGDTEAQQYFVEALKFYKRWREKTHKGDVSARTNQKTIFSLDTSTNCPNREVTFPCLYCYVEQATTGKGIFDILQYTNEILQMPDDLVRFINTQLGGMLVFSFGDYKPRAEEVVRKVFEDAKKKGLILKIITKNLEFAKKYSKLYDNAVFSINVDFENVTGSTPAEWVDDGMAIIRAFKSADFPSLMHELGRVFRRDLSPQDLEVVEKFCGVRRGRDGLPIWTREAEERFAYGYEKYLADGVAPTEELDALFKRFRVWMGHLYTNLRDRLELTPEARGVYDRLFYKPEAEKAGAEEPGQDSLATVPATLEDIINEETKEDWQARMIEAEPERVAREAESRGERRRRGLSAAYEVLRDHRFGLRDVQQLIASVECKRNRASIAKALGVKRWDAKARLMDEAIQLHIDIEGQEGYARSVRDSLTPHQQEVLDLALGLPESVAPVVERIKRTYQKLGLEAKGHEVINNLIDNYVNRMWDLKGKETNEILSKFQTKSKHAKKRVFTTILDGWLAGYELKVPGATNALRVYQMEISKVLADRKFIEGMAKARTVDGDPLLSTRQLEGYKRIDHPNFKLWRYSGSTSAEYITRRLREISTIRSETSTPTAPGASRGMQKIREVVQEAMLARGFSPAEADWYINKVASAETPDAANAAITEVTNLVREREVIDNVTFRKVSGKNYILLEDGTILERYDLYAPEAYAKDLNNILGTSKIKDIGVVRAISKFNAMFKTLLFAASLFQHMDYLRGGILGSWGSKGLALRPVKFVKLGLQAINNLEPAIVQGVRNGLTLFNKVDWEGEVFDETGFVGEILDKWKPTAELRRAAKTVIDKWSEFLFNTLGAGLKAKSYLIIMKNEIKHNPNEDIDVISKRVAQMVNENFGGLHFERMGRNPTAQHILRILMLAPDWTESSIRKYLGAFGVSYGRGKWEKLSPETRIMYQKLVFGSLLKGLAATVFANFLLAGGDPERFIEGYLQAFEDGNLSFMDVNITPLYEAVAKGLGIEPTGQRKYFSLLGYYKDPIKWARYPLKSLKYRASVGTSLALEALTRTDWAGRTFVPLRELIESGQTVKMYPKQKPVADWDWLPAYIINQLIGLSPIPIQQALAYAMGEQEGLDAIINATGLGVRTTY